jgi:EmrB/QacA subfamily drug resistance transporter
MSPAVPAPLDHAAIRSIMIGVMLAMFLGAIDQTIVATALPTIGRSFGDLENLSWVVSAYLLTATAVTPLYGKLSDIYGRRTMMLVGMGVFVAGSLACALSASMPALILSRALQGAGAGGLLPLAQIIIGDVIAPRERGRYQAYVGIVFVSASVSGPVIGGLLTEHLHWSLIFWINLPLGLIGLVMTHNLLKRLPRYERPHKLDVLGAVLMMGAGFTLLLALSWGGTRHPWLSPPILGLLAGSALLWALFAARLATGEEPFLPLSVLANPVVRLGTAAGACCMGTMIALTIFVPLYYESVLKLTASESGLALIPLMVVSTVASVGSAKVMGRVHRYKLLPIGGLILSIAALALLSLYPGALPVAVVSAVLGLIGLGLGTVFPVTTVAVQNAVVMHELGVATGVMNFFRQLASALLVAGFGAIVLGGLGVSGGSAIQSLTSAARIGLDVADVFRWVFAAAGGVLGVGLICFVAMEERPLRAHLHVPPVTPPSAVPAE